MKNIICAHCNNPYEPTDIRQKFCFPCKREKKRLSEIARKFNKRRDEGRREKGKSYLCSECGLPFVFSGGKQKLCGSEDCKKSYEYNRQKEWALKNPERRSLIHRRQREKRAIDPDYKKKMRLYSKEVSTPKLILARRHNPRKNLDHRMSQQLRSSIKRRKGGRSWKEILGYTSEELYNNIESKFLLGMAWDNMSEWHIDHIYPKSKFNYKDENDPEFKICWSLDNLQPLWAIENLKKSNKLDYKININAHKGE